MGGLESDRVTPMSFNMLLLLMRTYQSSCEVSSLQHSSAHAPSVTSFDAIYSRMFGDSNYSSSALQGTPVAYYSGTDALHPCDNCCYIFTTSVVSVRQKTQHVG